MTDNKKKPVYKRWWFILLAIIIIGGIIGATSEDKPKEEVKKDKQKEVEQVEANDNNDDNKTNELEEETNEPITIEMGNEVLAGDFTAKVQRVKIDDDKLTIVFDWENQSSWDKAHFELLGYIEVMQNGERLEQIGDVDRQYKQIKQGYFDVYDLEYKLNDSSDVEITIAATGEYDDTKEVITLSIPE